MPPNLANGLGWRTHHESNRATVCLPPRVHVQSPPASRALALPQLLTPVHARPTSPLPPPLLFEPLSSVQVGHLGPPL